MKAAFKIHWINKDLKTIILLNARESDGTKQVDLGVNSLAT